MFQLKLILLIFAGCLLFSSAHISKRSLRKTRTITKLPITILYESLCPDSKIFMRNLGQTYDEISNYVDITLVPFGKSASESDGAVFYCQHGAQECDGNRRQSCVLQSTTDQNAQVKFAVCQMQAYKPDVTECAQSSGISSDIADCVETETGTLLQLEAELITSKYEPTFIPTIIYNNNFNQRLQDRSIKDFRGTVCSILKSEGILPPQSTSCSDY